jgi:hypothetical protein
MDKNIIDREQYKEVLKCDSCFKESKLVLPVEYMLRFQAHDKYTNIRNNFTNICHSCVQKISKNDK